MVIYVMENLVANSPLKGCLCPNKGISTQIMLRIARQGIVPFFFFFTRWHQNIFSLSVFIFHFNIFLNYFLSNIFR